MNTPFNPDSWMDVVAYCILGLPAMIAAVTAVRWRGRANDHLATSKEMLNEVKNDHSTNLRDDIDEIARMVREGLLEIRKDIGGLREELRTERIERIEGDRRPAA